MHQNLRPLHRKVKVRTRVVNANIDVYDVYVARPSKWGNPYSHEVGTLAKYRVRTRKESIAKYRDWLFQQPELLAVLKEELQGKRLGCWCKPKSCHADILAQLADQASLGHY